MSVFREAERAYLAGGRQLGRIATVSADGTPHVVPVAFIYNAVRDTIDIGGGELERTKKFRDVARTGRARTRGTRAASRCAAAARRSRCRRR
jgi:pyridoxamine 5'-phosphate oxidase family protein